MVVSQKAQTLIKAIDYTGKWASTFRIGRPRPNKNIETFNTTELINKKLDQIKHLFITRKSRRSIVKQDLLD